MLHSLHSEGTVQEMYDLLELTEKILLAEKSVFDPFPKHFQHCLDTATAHSLLKLQ